MTRRAAPKDPVALARELLRSLGQDVPANDAESVVDEESIRELARQDAEEMRRARKR